VITEIPTPIEPDEESLRNVGKDCPHASGAHKYRLMQADTLIRLCGWIRQSDGSYRKPE